MTSTDDTPPPTPTGSSVGTSTPVVPTTVPPPAPQPRPRPSDPLMGTTEETYPGSGSFYYAFGGAPSVDWSKIGNLSSRLLTDLCYRSLDPVSGQKSALYRTKGLEKKFEKGEKLSDFQKKVWKHLRDYGLDTISYLPDPKDPSKVQTAVLYHARFTGDLDKAIVSCKNFRQSFDTWDKKNDYEARQFLLNSLSDTIKEGFETFNDDEDSFAATWLKLVHYLVTTTSKTYDKMKEQIRSKRPQQYPAQDIEKMAKDYLQLAKEMDNAGHYTHGLTLNMVDGFLSASKDSKGTFHHELNTLRSRVSKKEQETIFLSADEQAKSFARDGLGYKDVCLVSVKLYNELLSNNSWEPAKLPKDRHAPASALLTKAQVLTLIENAGRSGSGSSDKKKGYNNSGSDGEKSKGNCYNCGEPGHMAKECPKPKKTPDQARAVRHKSMSKWKLTAPGSGESHTKTVNGRVFKWCGKCSNWTTTHDTQGHTGTSNKPKKPAETNLAAWEPAAWHVEATDLGVTSVSSMSMLIMIPTICAYLYCALSLGYYMYIQSASPAPTFDVLSFFVSIDYKSVLHHLWSTWLINGMAPLLWFTLGYMVCYTHRQSNPPFNPIIDAVHLSRDQRRLNPRHKKAKWKVKSAREHNLHHAYPLRLRKDNIFHPRSSTPTCTTRDNFEFIHDITDHVHNRPSRRHKQPQPIHKVKAPFGHSSRPGVYSTHKSKGGIQVSTKPRHNSFCQHHTKPRQHHANHSTSTSSKWCAKCMTWTVNHDPKTCVYAPRGVITSRSKPNLNLTSKQLHHLRANANRVLVLGTKVSEETKRLARKIASLSPSTFKAEVENHNKCHSFPIIWDSGASVCVTPDKNDFLSYKTTTDISKVKGLGGKVSTVIGQGEVLWSVHDTGGTLRHLKLKAYHIPQCQSRLISTSSLLASYKGEHLTIDSTSMRLSGMDGDSTRNPIIAFNNPLSNLPTTLAYQYNSTDVPAQALCHTVSTVNSNNANLSEAQKELLRWHQRLGHLAFKKIQHLMRTGVLSHTEGTRGLHTAASKLIEPPKCAACLFGKQTVRSSPGSKTTVIRDRAGVLRAGNLLPGSEVSVDHFISSVKGRLFSGYDKGGDDTRYVGGCIFIDHSSSYIHVEFQSSLSTHETLRAKMAFERQCRDVGVVVHKYMSDNGKAFSAKDFQDHLSDFAQVSKFAGVGAHHHNAQAERAIRTIMSISRTMMIHAGIHWPDMAKATLWPMAVAQACYLFNHVPDPSTGLSPSDIFTKTRWPHKRFHDFHVWGCPVYVLDKSLQDGKKIPKWRPRSARSIYMGVSLNHASSVPLVLNTSTGAVTPQFHIVFDDWFATVPSFEGDTPDFSANDWNKMFGDSRYQYVLDEEVSPDEEANASDQADTAHHDQQSDSIGLRQDDLLPPTPLDVQPPAQSTPPSNSASLDNTEWVDIPHHNDNDGWVDVAGSDTSKGDESSELPTMPKSTTPASASTPLTSFETQPKVSPERKLDIPPVHRPRRVTSQVKRLTYTHDKKSLTHLAWAYAAAANVDLCNTDWIEVEISGDSLLLDNDSDVSVLVSSKVKNDPSLFSYEEAMEGENREDWIKAAKSEIVSLENLECWEEVPLDQATSKVLPGTWVFKIKTAPDGSFKKFKASYCIRGDLQEGDFDTYAPVVSFSSVRLFLAWSLMLDWYTCSIDFSNAFIQATLNEPTFIHLPRGFTTNSKTTGKTCLRLKKSIYGLAVAPRLWFKHLLEALKSEGLIQSKHDACLMFRHDMIVICYVDDLGIQVPHESIVDTLIKNLVKKGFELTREGTFSEYLGIQYKKLDSNTVSMTQSGLIKKILEATGMNECNPNKTPSTREALGSDPEGKDMDEAWNYRSVVGMLIYLSTNTRPDIAFAVSQVARFSHSPKRSHASAVKTIVRYLSGTLEMGVMYKRPKVFTLDCYVDADFAGLYGREPSEDPISVKSRTGYIISVGGCFLLCKSQLQSTIALSTSESEYGALSQAMRTLLPIRETMLEIIEAVNMVDGIGNAPFGTKEDLLKFKTHIYEDNSSALSLAVNQKITSRTKHWCVKSHFFWSHVNDPSKNLTCLKVDTKNQRADYLTKGLTKDLFQHCRELNQGW